MGIEGNLRYGVVVCIIIQWTFFNNSKHAIDEDIKKLRAQNWALCAPFCTSHHSLLLPDNFHSLMSVTWLNYVNYMLTNLGHMP